MVNFFNIGRPGKIMRRVFVILVALCLVWQPVASASPVPLDTTRLLLDENAGGKTFQLNVGETVELTLAGNPTTGYTWQFVEKPDPGLLQETDHGFREDNPQGLAGAGGREFWVFQATASGSVSIRLQYLRPWEIGTPPVKTFAAEIKIGTDKDNLQNNFPGISETPGLVGQPLSDQDLNDMIKKMTIEEKVGQMIMPAFRKLKDIDVTEINDEIWYEQPVLGYRRLLSVEMWTYKIKKVRNL